MKQNQIYNQIRNEIICGRWKVGDKLPTEIEYSQNFSVARNTLRCAFKMLEDEGFIERVKSKGTFVKMPKIKLEDKNISLLVPCYEYFYCSSINFMNFMFELIAQAANVFWRVTPVIFSKTNNPKDIWYENMAHFNNNSKIVINRKWFSHYFSNLANLGSSVAFINNDSNYEDETTQYTSKWMNFIEEDKVASRKSIDFLIFQSCKKIALAMPQKLTKDNSLGLEFNSYCQKLNIQNCYIELDGKHDKEIIQKVYQQEKFDGLILHANEMQWSREQSLRSYLKLGKDFPVVAIPMIIQSIYQEENIPIIKYCIKDMAKDIVTKLTQSQSISCTMYYTPNLVLNNIELDF